MARKRQATKAPEPPRYLIRIGHDRDRKVRIVGYAGGGDFQFTGEYRPLTDIRDVEVGRPFRYHVPSDGRGPSGFVFDGFTGENACPWSAGQVLAAARYGLFGFRLVADGAGGQPCAST